MPANPTLSAALVIKTSFRIVVFVPSGLYCVLVPSPLGVTVLAGT